MSGSQPSREPAGEPGRDAADERLLALLEDLVRDAGRMKTAESLGVSYRTLVRAIETGTLLARMRDVLERRLLAEGGEEAVRQRARAEALERRVEALEERLAAGEQQGDGTEASNPSARTELAHRLDEGVAAVEALAGRVARLEEHRPRAPGHTALPAVSGNGERAHSSGRGVVMREPPPGEAQSYGAGTALVEEWRALNGRRGAGTKLDQAKVRERVMELEIAMIGEHELTLPPNTEPLHPSERERYLGWRRQELADIRGERRRREARRWLRRLLTLGLWWR